jgi:ABC-type multidrug transport system fused ATPase/permease subunit
MARALIKQTNLLIFDEATSALDASSEHEVQSAIDKISKETHTTTIIIAHRLSTVKNCDRIIVMKGGEVIEQGTHAELLEADGEYKLLV